MQKNKIVKSKVKGNLQTRKSISKEEGRVPGEAGWQQRAFSQGADFDEEVETQWKLKEETKRNTLNNKAKSNAPRTDYEASDTGSSDSNDNDHMKTVNITTHQANFSSPETKFKVVKSSTHTRQKSQPENELKQMTFNTRVESNQLRTIDQSKKKTLYRVKSAAPRQFAQPAPQSARNFQRTEYATITSSARMSPVKTITTKKTATYRQGGVRPPPSALNSSRSTSTMQQQNVPSIKKAPAVFGSSVGVTKKKKVVKKKVVQNTPIEVPATNWTHYKISQRAFKNLIKKSDIQEMKGARAMSPLITKLMRAVAIILGHSQIFDGTVTQAVIELNSVDVNDISARQVMALQSIVEAPVFTMERISNISRACVGLAEWVHQIYLRASLPAETTIISPDNYESEASGHHTTNIDIDIPENYALSSSKHEQMFSEDASAYIRDASPVAEVKTKTLVNPEVQSYVSTLVTEEKRMSKANVVNAEQQSSRISTVVAEKKRMSKAERIEARELERMSSYRPEAIKITHYAASSNKWANPDIEAKAEALRKEMEALMAGGFSQNRNSTYDASFYEEYMNDFEGGGDKVPKKHISPTTRLRQHKDSTVEHKDMIRKSLKRSSDYSLTYCLSPDKAYVVEPEGGELNYEEAYANKKKFEQKVHNRDDTVTNVKRKSIHADSIYGEVKTVAVLDTAHGDLSTQRKSLGMMQTTKRKSMSVASLSDFQEKAIQRQSTMITSTRAIASSGPKPKIESVQKAIADGIMKHVLRHKATEEHKISEREIKKAMQSQGVKTAIREHICDENISLADAENKEVYQSEIFLLGSMGNSNQISGLSAGLNPHKTKEESIEPDEANVRMQPQVLTDVMEAIVTEINA